MKNSIFLAAVFSVCGALSASAATINFQALNDGNGNGTNPGASVQPIGIAALLDPTSTFDAFSEPALTDGVNVASISTSNIGGTTLEISEGTFDSFGNSGAAGMLSDIDFSRSSVDFEASVPAGGNGTGQGNGKSDAWGVDSDGVSSTSSNTVLAFKLANNIFGSFSTLLLDLEGGAPNAASAFVGVYDDTGTLAASETLNFPGGAYGNDAEYLFTFENLGLNSTIAFFVGDDVSGGDGHNERIAVADFATYQIAPVPLPAPGILLGASLVFLVGFRRKS